MNVTRALAPPTSARESEVAVAQRKVVHNGTRPAVKTRWIAATLRCLALRAGPIITARTSACSGVAGAMATAIVQAIGQSGCRCGKTDFGAGSDLVHHSIRQRIERKQATLRRRERRRISESRLANDSGARVVFCMV
jgi:hypothetical protein